MQKLYAVDLDGTLFYPKHPLKILSKKTVALINKIADRGDIFATVSGRNIPECIKVFNKVKLSPTIIGCNGSYIYANNEIIFSKCLDGDVTKKIIEYVRNKYKTIGLFVMNKNGKTYLENKLPTIFYRFCGILYNFFQGKLLKKYRVNNSMFNESIDKNETWKLMIMFGISKKAKLIAKEASKELFKEFGNQVSICWSDQIVEITPLGCTKADSLLRLIDVLSIKHDDVIVIGDSGNDIPMFKEFPNNSYCMNHSSQTIKKYAKYILNSFNTIETYLGN